jgi:superfamily II DNA or RNA helicase
MEVVGNSHNIKYVHELFEQYMSFYTDNYKYDSRYKSGVWDGKIRFINTYGGKMLAGAGLLPLIATVLKNGGVPVKIDDNCKGMFYSAGAEEATNEWLDVIGKKLKYDPAAHQRKMVVSAMKYKRIVLESPTGSGKSMGIFLTVLRYINTHRDGRILLMVPTVSLVDQMYDDFVEYCEKDLSNVIGRVYGDDKIDKDGEFDKQVIISTVSSVGYRLGVLIPKDKDKKAVYIKTDKELAKKFGMVIIDEVHGASSATLQNIINMCTNAEYRVGFTGTVPIEEVSAHAIFGAIGPKMVIITTKELIDLGVLSKVLIVGMVLNYDDAAVKKATKMSYESEVAAIESNGSRPAVFDYLMKEGYISEDTNTMMLFNYRESIETMKAYIESNYSQFKVLTFHGDVSPEDKKAVRDMMEAKPGYILLATFGAAAAGVSIRRLHNLILASSYKKYIRVVQAIGRILRVHPTKNIAMVFDMIDNMAKPYKGYIKDNHLMKHWKARLELYKMQQFDVRKLEHPDKFSIPDKIVLHEGSESYFDEWGL